MALNKKVIGFVVILVVLYLVFGTGSKQQPRPAASSAASPAVSPAASPAALQVSNKIGLFSPNGYYELHGDVRSAGVGAKDHFCAYGFSEGRGIKLDTGDIGKFSTDGYYELHPDVRAAGIGAKDHFCASGFDENRKIKLI